MTDQEAANKVVEEIKATPLPKISFNDESRTITLECTQDLWDRVQELKAMDMASLDMVSLAKIYFKLKPALVQLMKGENEKS